MKKLQKKHKKILVLAGIILIVVGLVAGVIWAQPKPGAYVEGSVKIQYEDGSEIVIGSEDQQLLNLLSLAGKKLSVMTYQGKKLWGISTDINLRFSIDPPDKKLNCQYWILYWIEVDGPYFSGSRGYSSLTGFLDTPVSHYGTVKSLNKWQAKVGNPEIGFFTIKSFVDPFYQEATSSVWVDLSTYIVDPQTVTDSLLGIPIVGGLADKLGAYISATEVSHGQKPLVVDWQMDGPDFYVRLKRSNFNGFSVHIGDFSVGAGDFARMWDNDRYRLSFKVGYFFRYQDITGEWTRWNHGTATIATMEMNIAEGSWYLLSADVSGGVGISTLGG